MAKAWIPHSVTPNKDKCEKSVEPRVILRARSVLPSQGESRLQDDISLEKQWDHVRPRRATAPRCAESDQREPDFGGSAPFPELIKQNSQASLCSTLLPL